MIPKIYWQEFKLSLMIALPVAASQLGHMFVGVTDTIMSGTFGSKSMAAATVATSVFIPILMFGIGISYGVTPLVAQAEGGKNLKLVKHLFRHSLILNTLIGVVLFIFLAASGPFLRFLNQPEEVIELAIPFYETLSLSIIPLMIFQTFKQFAEGLSITKEAMIISLVGNILNIGLIFLFIDKWSLVGIALATFLARVFMAVAMIAVLVADKRFKMYRFPIKEIFNRLDKTISLKMIKISLPVGSQMIMESGAFGAAAIMVGWIGADEIDAHQIALNIAAVAYMGATGIGSAATVRVGHKYGEKDIAGMRIAALVTLSLVIAYNLVTATLFFVFKNALPSFFINDLAIINAAASLLVIAGLFQISDGLQVVALGCLRGMNDVKIPTLAVTIAYWVIGLPAGYVLAFKFNLGLSGVWYGLLIGLSLIASFLVLRFFTKTRKILPIKEFQKIQIVDLNQ